MGTVVSALSWPVMSMGCLRGTALVICVLCVHREEMLVAVHVWFVEWQVYRFDCCPWAIVLHGESNTLGPCLAYVAFSV